MITFFKYKKETGLITVCGNGPSDAVGIQDYDDDEEVAYGIPGNIGQYFNPVTHEITNQPF